MDPLEIIQPITQNAKQVLPSHYKVTIKRISGSEDLQGSLLQEMLEKVLHRLDVEDLTSGFTVDFCHCRRSVKSHKKTIRSQFQPPVFKIAKTVSELQRLNFLKLTLQEKLSIKLMGPPTPDILVLLTEKSNNKKLVRHFKAESYKKKSWLCGCEVKKALFCFPCLLYGGESKWTKNGFENFKCLSKATEEHEKSVKHIENSISLTLLGTKNNISLCNTNDIIEYNKKVIKNRKILSKLIDCMLFCGNFANHSYNEDDSTNPSLFRELVDFASKLDADLKIHLETNPFFMRSNIKELQYQLLDCIFPPYQNKLIEDIRTASFVAVMVDDLMDISEAHQIVIVIRYLLKQNICEHLWGIFIPEKDTAEALSKCILKELNIILPHDEHKLIAQSLNGEIFMNGNRETVRKRIKEVYYNAHLVHCYTHELDIIVKNAAYTTNNSRVFFANIMAISNFFSNEKYMNILQKHAFHNDSQPLSSRAVIEINKSIVRTIYSVHFHLQALKSCLKEIQTSSSLCPTISEVTGMLMVLNDSKFMFWLEFFRKVLPRIEVIHKKMQYAETGGFKVKYINDFNILANKDWKYLENLSINHMAESKVVQDFISKEMEERYSFTNHLTAANLFNKNHVECFNQLYPANEIGRIIEAYPMINREKLDSELQVFYSRSHMHSFPSLAALLKFLTDHNLDTILSEITRLINIILTTPMPSSETGRCLPTLNRIKTFMKNNSSLDKLNPRAVISTENEFLKTNADIKEKVIDHFSLDSCRMQHFAFR